MPLLLALLGGLAGGTLRYRTERTLQTRARCPTHWGPFTLNFLGCFLIGALAGWAYRSGLGWGTALLGGSVVAFSVCGYETAQLLGGGRHGRALVSALAGWFIGLAASAMGVFLALG
ncbi:CrcB family protein [Streptomyces sp. SL13]|jgi:CrcB protein|uniref:Fluoride-specific ion channel n=1 Tax=Streptantibioticus silvisoli TaxID=2705255 RepID=A0AA90H5S0_9ACTN|nr:CrcB family protein [Streptantibioticus silvisoli]MDI5962160.1 CrcB family protein [Streptantibioticus silvisoli]MDI5972426.1 CrcB family protein [Streptantibioticus silvisoli]